jgi:PPP family 3-phenylpropionic acid transporter
VSRTAIRPAVAVQVLFLLFGFVIAAFFPFIALFLEDRGLSVSRIGLVIAFMAVGRVLCSPIWGHLADATLGRRRTLQIGMAGAGVAALVLFRTHELGPIVVVAFVLAAFSATTGPNMDAIALEHLGDERLTDYGKIRGWESLTYAAGCFAFGLTLQQVGVRWQMPIFAAASFLVLVWSFAVRRDRPRRVEGHGRLGTVGAVFREAPRFWGFLAAVLLVWIGFNGAWNFIALKIERGGGGPLLVGIGTALGGCMEVVVMRIASRLQARMGLRFVYVLGCCIYAGGFLAWGLIANATVVSLLTVFEGTAFALLFTTGVVVIGRMLPSSLYSTGQSIAAMTGFGIGPILGAGIGGVVYQRFGPAVLYAGASALALSAALVAWVALSTPALSRPRRDPATAAVT